VARTCTHAPSRRQRFRDCTTEKNGTLIRYDILEVFRKSHDAAPDEQLKQHALALIETEEDPKYREKYSGLWKDLAAKKSGAKVEVTRPSRYRSSR